MPRESREYVTVERWRVERAIDDLFQLAIVVADTLPEPLRRPAGQLVYAENADALQDAERALIDAALDYAEEHASIDALRRVRADCPICGHGTQQTGPWTLPVGLERHLWGHGGNRCRHVEGMYRAAVQLIARQAGRPLMGLPN